MLYSCWYIVVQWRGRIRETEALESVVKGQDKTVLWMVDLHFLKWIICLAPSNAGRGSQTGSPCTGRWICTLEKSLGAVCGSEIGTSISPSLKDQHWPRGTAPLQSIMFQSKFGVVFSSSWNAQLMLLNQGHLLRQMIKLVSIYKGQTLQERPGNALWLSADETKFDLNSPLFSSQ